MPKLFIDGLEANIDTANYTAFHGNSVFSTMRSKRGEICFWPEHYERLSSHAHYFGFLIPPQSKLMAEIGTSLKQTFCDQKIRVILNQASYAITMEDYVAPPAHIYEGVEIIFSHHKPHPQYQRFKTGNSLPYMLAAQEAAQAQVFEALLVDHNAMVVDGSRTSIMHWDGHSLFAIDGGLLGIMSKNVLAHAQKMGMLVARKLIAEFEFKQNLKQQEGQFLLCNSLIGVVPIGPARSEAVQKIVDHFRMS